MIDIYKNYKKMYEIQAKTGVIFLKHDLTEDLRSPWHKYLWMHPAYKNNNPNQ